MPSATRRYLRARKMTSPARAALETTQILDEWRTLRLKTALGRTFLATERIVVRRPRFMPRRLYLWLMSTVVFEAPSEGDS